MIRFDQAHPNLQPVRVSRLNSQERLKNESKSEKDRALTFVIVHYAMNVTYDARGFLEKNKYKLTNELVIAHFVLK